MSTLYLIGGSPRCGKSTILQDFIKNNPIIAVPTDTIRAGVRYINKHGRTNFPSEMVEQQIPWEMVVGIVHHYDHKNISIVIEGAVITPERVKSLEVNNLEVKAVFVGFTEASYIENIFEHAYAKKDWVYDRIIRDGGDETGAREQMQGILENNIKIAKDAENLGYKFVSPSGVDFEDYKNNVINYLLS
jgi:hypothetical protein